jgi:hypothetical protein
MRNNMIFVVWCALKEMDFEQNAIYGCLQIFSMVMMKRLSLASSFPAILVHIVLLKDRQV